MANPNNPNKGTLESQKNLTAETKLTAAEVKKWLNGIENVEKATIKSLETQRQLAAIRGDNIAVAEKEYEILKRYSKEIAQAAEREAELTQEELDLLDEKKKIVKEILGEEEDINRAMKERKKIMSDINKAAQSFGKSFFGGIASKIGLASDMSNTFIGQLTKMNTIIKQGGGEQLATEFHKIFNFGNFAASAMKALVQATIAMVLAADKAVAAFAASTGAGRMFTNEIAAVGQQHRNLGLTMEDAGKSATALYNKYPGFAGKTLSQRQGIIKLTASLSKLGVAMEDSAQIMSDFQKGQKLSTEGAMRMAQELALSAKSLQMSAGEYTKGFLEANKTLAVYGKNAVKIYQKMTAAAQAAGVKTEKLLGIAAKFDTFEDAAKSTGKLNAILGSQLSASEMLMASEEERIEILIKSMQAQGVAFKDMDRFTQKAVAATLGISDLNQAQKILGMDLSSYRKMNRAAASSAKEQEEMNKRMKEAMDVGKKFAMMLAEFAAQIQPFVKSLAEASQYLLDLVHRTKNWLPQLITLAFALSTLSKIFMVFGPILKVMGMVWLKIFGKSAESAGKSMGKAAPQGAAFAASMMGVSIAVGLVLLGAALLVGLMVLLVHSIILLAESGDGAVGVLIGLGVALWGFSLAVASLANPISATGLALFIAFIVAMTLMAWATAAAGEGMSKAATSVNEMIEQGSLFTDYVDNLWSLGQAFKGVGRGLEAMAEGMALLSLASPLIGILERIMAAVTPFVQAIASIAQSISEVIGELVNLDVKDVASLFTSISSGLSDIGDTASIDTEKGASITHTLENLALITTGTSAKSGDGGMGGVVKALKGLNLSTQVNIKISGEELKKLIRGDTVKFLTEAGS
tara:strand:+ start:2044 stop:4629 length:2586 start_codon:yes stop_codon:yes gene_type:complete